MRTIRAERTGELVPTQDDCVPARCVVFMIAGCGIINLEIINSQGRIESARRVSISPLNHKISVIEYNSYKL